VTAPDRSSTIEVPRAGRLNAPRSEPGITVDFLIRSVGERTAELCAGLIRCSGHEPVVLRESTHFKAIEQTYRYGLESRAEWVIAVDADVVLSPRDVESFLVRLARQQDDVDVVYPGIADKLYRMERWAGLQVYRQTAFSRLLPMLLEKKGSGQLKVERACIESLRCSGRGVFFEKCAIGLHDFFQYRRDIYRKVYLNCVRNRDMNQRASRLWKRHSAGDPDYEVALLALHDAAREQRSLENSIHDFTPAEIRQRLRVIGVEEKGPLDPGAFLRGDLEARIAAEARALHDGAMFNDYFQVHPLISRARSLATRIKSALASR